MNCKYCQNESCVMAGIPNEVPNKCPDAVATNADRIRGMTDEELAIFLCNNVDCAFCESIKGNCTVGCKDRMLLWLKDQVEEVDNG